MQFAANFKKLCKYAGVTQKQVLADLNLGRNAAQRWIDGFPNAETVNKIANYFQIPADWLLNDKDLDQNLDQTKYNGVVTYSDLQMFAGQKKEPVSTTEDELSEYDKAVLNWFQSLPAETRQVILKLGDAPAILIEDPDRG